MWKWKKICAILQTAALAVSVNPTAVSGLDFTTGVEAEADELLTSAEDQMDSDLFETEQNLPDVQQEETVSPAPSETEEQIPADAEADDMVPVEVVPEDLITDEVEPEEAALFVEEAEASVPEVGARAPHSDYHTIAEIRAFVKSHPIQYLPAAYTVEPLTTAPYRIGSLTDEVQQDALNALNIMRYIAGIPADVTIYDGYKDYAQGVTLANAVNGRLSHYPAQPQGMDDTLYRICSRGGANTNIAWSSAGTTLVRSVIFQWMADEDKNNIDRVGHRRWCLNPGMKRTAFGQTGTYSSMYSTDGAFAATSYDSMWPGQMMPVEFFEDDYPWSYSTGDSENASSIQVTLKNENTGKTWHFSQGSSDGYFNVSTGAGIALDGCIVFKPDDISYTAGDIYDVTITGTASGTISYTVTFFPLYERPITSVAVEGPSALPVGSSAQYTIKVEPEDTDEPKPTLITSENPAIVSIDESGIAVGLAAGSYTWLVCRSGNRSPVWKYVEVYIPVTSITLDKTEITEELYKQGNITATVLPENAGLADLTWSSDNEDVVRVFYDGSYYTMGAGTALITCTNETTGVSATCRMNVVIPVYSVGISRSSLSLIKGETAKLTAYVNSYGMGTPTNTNVTWTSSNSAIASVDSNGNVTAKGAGTCDITVTTEDGGKTATCKVTVTVPVTGVTLNKTSLTLNKGDTSTLTATIAPSDAINKSLTWTSSNTSVATVDSNGKVTARAAGSCNITVKTVDGAKTAVCAVTVKVPVTGVTLNKTSLSLNKGATSTLTATIAPSDATNKSLTWTSSNTSVATVDSTGKVTAKGAGSCNITVKTADGAKTAVCAVTVTMPVTGVTLNKTSLTLNKGAASTLTATVAPSDATDKSLTWTSSNTSVATVDNNGKVTAKAAGSCNITVKTADGAKTAVCAVTVKVPVTGVTLNKTSLALNKGGTSTLTATVAPSDATNKSVTWTSSNTAVATVDANGKVTAKAAGSSNITVKTVDGAKTAVCAVTVKVPVTGVTLNKTSLSLNKGGSSTLTATIAPSDATNKSVTWTSSNTSVATVDANGKVTAKAGGSCSITAKTADGAKTAVCSVTVTVPVTAIKIRETEASVAAGSSIPLTTSITPSDATDQAVTWTVSDEKTASVSCSGLVTGKKAGMVTVTVTTHDGQKQDGRDVRILFKDVTDGSKFYYDPVYWTLDNGVTAGKTGDMFAPGEVCTRGQVVTFLWRASGSPKAGDVKNPFTDVIEGKYYYDAVLWAVGQGITAGTSATTFSPNEPCTRGQVATFLWRAKGKPAVSGTANPFTDVKPGKYYYDAVLWAVDQKITAGTTPTAFTPDGQCTRGHIVTFLYRAR